MTTQSDLLLGEFSRTLDERYRIGLPSELVEPLVSQGQEMVLAKERAGCLSLWNAVIWKPRIDAAVDVLRSKLAAGVLAQRVDHVQGVGRLLSTRHRTISLAAAGAWLFPMGSESFSVLTQEVICLSLELRCVLSFGIPTRGATLLRLKCRTFVGN